LGAQEAQGVVENFPGPEDANVPRVLTEGMKIATSAGLHISMSERLGPDALTSEPIIPVGDRKRLLADLAARLGWRPYMVTEQFVNRFASRAGVPNVGIRHHVSIT
jgi:hypothetical protein